MTYEDILNQAVAMLQRQRCLTYQSLQLQFHLDESHFEVLKNQLLYAHPQAVSDDGHGLVWTGNPLEPAHNAYPETDSEARFHAVLPEIKALLQREERVTYSTIKVIFGVDDAFLETVRKELVFKQLAVDENGEGLVGTGKALTDSSLMTTVPRQPHVSDISKVISPIAPTHPLIDTEAVTQSSGLSSQPGGLPTAVLSGEPGVASESARYIPAAERRQLTVMFCDLVGSTDLSGQLDPEDLREVVQAYQETAAEVIERYEGHIAQYLGDGLLIYFGFPVAHEDDAQRAVYTGLGISEALATLNRRLAADFRVKLAVRIGIHTGPVVVGEMGGGERHEQLALGETPNIAARLEALAAHNTVAISPVTARLVSHAFVLDELGVHELRGVADSMVVFRVREPREVDPDDETTRGGFEVLVGRDDEIGLLQHHWKQSKEGVGQVVLLTGEAGLGKSSLIEGLRRQVRQEGCIPLVFRCSPYSTNSALYPVLAHLQRGLGWQRDDLPETKLTKLERGLAGVGRSLEATVPLIAALLSLPLPEEKYPALTLSGPQQRQQGQDLLVSWLVARATHQPILVVWEDLHWADPSTLELLGLIIEQASTTTTMLHVLTYRPEFELPWPLRSHITPIFLNRLDRHQVEALITQQAEGKILPAEVIDHIITKTDGVPLYIEELTKMLMTSKLLVPKADRYELTGPMLGVTIPDTLQDSLMARLDQLKAPKQIAQLGAVFGRTFSYLMLQTLYGMEEDSLQEGLSQLVESELLYQRGRPPQATYIFKHALIQDTAYASLLRRRRQQVHQQIAQLIETQFSETVETQPELLAHHYTEAGQAEVAMRYWQRAGERAMQRSAYAEAIANFTQGLTLIPSLPETPERTQHELTLRIALAAPLLATKGYAAPEVGDAYNRARELCQQMDETPQLFPVLHGLWTFQIVRGDLKTANWLADQLLTLAQHLDDRDFLVEAHLTFGLTTFFEGAFDRAQPYWDQVWSQYDPQQHHAHISGYLGLDPGVLSRIMSAWTLWYRGYPDQALTYAEEAMVQAVTLAHPYTLAYTHNYMARLHQCRRELSAAQAEAEASLAICTAHGFNLYVAGGNILHGWAVAAQGQSEDGAAQIRQNLELWRSTGAALTVPYYLALLAEACGEDIDAGLAALGEGFSAMEKSQERFYEAEFHGLRGDLLRQRVQPDEEQIEACFGQALDVARQQGATSLELRAAIRLARLWQSQGKRQKACDLLTPIYDWFTEGFDTADLIDAKALLTELDR